MEEKTNHKTVLGADCRITGELVLDNDAVIMGQFKGTLRVTGMLELTESAQVSGLIIAGAIRLAGQVDADVIAETGVELMATAQLDGQLFTSRITVVEGAVFNGDVCVGPKAMEAAADLINKADAQAAQPTPAPQQQQQRVTATREASTLSSAMALVNEQDESAGEDQSVRTIPSSLNSILQRRRAKVLSTAQQPSDQGNDSRKAG